MYVDKNSVIPANPLVPVTTDFSVQSYGNLKKERNIQDQ
jgi:hypothetical protein